LLFIVCGWKFSPFVLHTLFYKIFFNYHLRSLRENNLLRNFAIPFFLDFFHSPRFQPWVDEIARLETGNSYKHRLETGANGTTETTIEGVENIEGLETEGE